MGNAASRQGSGSKGRAGNVDPWVACTKAGERSFASAAFIARRRARANVQQVITSDLTLAGILRQFLRLVQRQEQHRAIFALGICERFDAMKPGLLKPHPCKNLCNYKLFRLERIVNRLGDILCGVYQRAYQNRATS